MSTNTTLRDFDYTMFAGEDAARRVRGMSSQQVRTFIWQLWPGRNWPCTAEEEAQFVADMRARAEANPAPASKRKNAPAFDRNDVTAMINALRCGLTCADLLERAPGLKPHRIMAAYDEIERLRAQSVNAWHSLVADPTLESLVDWAAAASVLLPTPVRNLLPAAAAMDAEAMSDRVTKVAERVDAVTTQAVQVEKVLAGLEAPSAQGIAIGRMLYDPYDPSLWADPHFLPPRVGTLMPLRLADLLGERRL